LSHCCNCWSSPAQSFLVPSAAGPMNIFYSLRFETSSTCKTIIIIIIIIIIIWFVRLLALRPLLAYCASIG
jgi:hypothetical protein